MLTNKKSTTTNHFACAAAQATQVVFELGVNIQGPIPRKRGEPAGPQCGSQPSVRNRAVEVAHRGCFTANSLAYERNAIPTFGHPGWPTRWPTIDDQCLVHTGGKDSTSSGEDWSSSNLVSILSSQHVWSTDCRWKAIANRRIWLLVKILYCW